MDTQDRNADDIRTLTAAVTRLTREMGENNQKTAQAIEKADEARGELAEHVVECTEVNRRLEYWIIGALISAWVGKPAWDLGIAPLLGL